jgi:hypothetical protein
METKQTQKKLLFFLKTPYDMLNGQWHENFQPSVFSIYQPPQGPDSRAKSVSDKACNSHRIFV